jgi:hypothetical protein
MAKDKMNTKFEANRLLPGARCRKHEFVSCNVSDRVVIAILGDERFEYDKRVDFEPPSEQADWDEDDDD